MLEILDNGMTEFESAIKPDRTRKLYHYYLRRFLEITELKTPEALLALGKKEPQKLTNLIIRVIQG